MGFNSKHRFAPPTACWGFSFALACGVSPHSCSSTYHLTGVSLTLDLGYLHTAGPTKCSHCSWPRMWRISSWPLTTPCHHFIANRWRNNGRLYFLGSKITAGGVCSHEIKRRLLLGRKVMTKLESILKTRNIALPTKVHLEKTIIFPIVMYGSESWTIKKA